MIQSWRLLITQRIRSIDVTCNREIRDRREIRIQILGFRVQGGTCLARSRVAPPSYLNESGGAFRRARGERDGSPPQPPTSHSLRVQGFLVILCKRKFQVQPSGFNFAGLALGGQSAKICQFGARTGPTQSDPVLGSIFWKMGGRQIPYNSFIVPL